MAHPEIAVVSTIQDILVARKEQGFVTRICVQLLRSRRAAIDNDMY
jgi:hypothetical protein